MSSFIFENGKILPFRQFLLSESIKPNQISYGTDKDFKNSNILKIDKNYLTSFMYDDKVFTVIIADNEVGFHFTYTKNINFENFDYINSIMENDSFMYLGASNAARVFGYVFFIIIDIIKKYNLKIVSFNGEHDKLDSVYKKMVHNRFFIKEFEDLGFKYEYHNNLHTFVKI